ncbi:MAG: FAD-dependent oxidoreductase [Rhodobacteraceae bacterium]|nr:FAD-dependent oxidoreductase [Paracoccaceae bacterium]
MGGIVIIGGGQAGSSLASKLRNLGCDGEITLICGEPVPPYQRPPLSKQYLLGEMEKERLYLRPQSFYDEQNITLMLDTQVSSIDPAARSIHANGQDIAYDQLALTTGSDPRMLPDEIGGALKGVFAVRTLADVDAMAAAFTPGKRVLIVGGGYIGLEAAAVASKLGLSVTLIELAPRILQRVACPETSDYFRDLHKGQGVDLREGVGLKRLTGEAHVDGAELGDGSMLDLDFVVVGVGITPATGLAEAAGLTIDNGIAVDGEGRTSDAHIWAAGDCASFPYKGGRIRLESVQNAIDQAECVAENMLGAGKTYFPQPWFWSDQYDIKLQIAGLSTGYDGIVLRPGTQPGMQSHWYYKGDRLLAVDAMNDTRGYMVGKRLIEAGKSPDRDVIANPETDLKALLRA